MGAAKREKEDRGESDQAVLRCSSPVALPQPEPCLRLDSSIGPCVRAPWKQLKRRGSVSKPIVPLAPFPPPPGKERVRGRREILFQGNPSLWIGKRHPFAMHSATKGQLLTQSPMPSCRPGGLRHLLRSREHAPCPWALGCSSSCRAKVTQSFPWWRWPHSKHQP